MKLDRGVLALAGAKFALHIGTTRLGYHRDELYFVAASKRLSASYVDFQPVTPLLVRAVRAVAGDSLVALRVVPALAGASAVVLAALIARELGGNRRAQLLAAFALLVVPLFVGMDTAVNTVSLETPAWLLAMFVFARLVRTDDRRLWVALGAAFGLALLVKFTVLGYLLGFAVAVIATPLRRHLRSPWPWIGAGVALAMVAPSLLWQASHGFPVVEFVRHQGTGGRVLGLGGRFGYVVSLVVLPGPLALLLLLPGARRVLRSPIGIAQLSALAVFLVAGGKGYYAAPAIAVLLVAGAVAVASRATWRPRGLIAALLVNLLIPLPLVLPIVPVSVLRASQDVSDATELGERIGWDEFARTIARVERSLDAADRGKVIVLGQNYTQAAVVEFYARRFRLPPSMSGHNSAYLWWPRIPRDHVAIAIGYSQEEMDALYSDVTVVTHIRNREGVHNYEWGEPVFVARRPKVSPAELRERVRIFTS